LTTDKRGPQKGSKGAKKDGLTTEGVRRTSTEGHKGNEAWTTDFTDYTDDGNEDCRGRSLFAVVITEQGVLLLKRPRWV